ncbi:MAG: hypothetical protein WDN46_22660 [Methylocella sp.]
MNIFKLLAVTAIVAGSTGFVEAKQARSHFYDRQPAQEEGITTGRSVGVETQNLPPVGVQQLPPARGSFEPLPPARGPYEVY